MNINFHWCHGDRGSQAISSHSVDLVNAEHHIPASTPEVLIKKSNFFSYNIKNALMKYMGFIPCLPRCLKQLSLHCDILSYNLKCIHVFSYKSWMIFIQTSNTWFRMYRTHYGQCRGTCFPSDIDDYHYDSSCCFINTRFHMENWIFCWHGTCVPQIKDHVLNMLYLIFICSKIVWSQEWIINWTHMWKHSQEDEHICYDLERIVYSEHTRQLCSK